MVPEPNSDDSLRLDGVIPTAAAFQVEREPAVSNPEEPREVEGDSADWL